MRFFWVSTAVEQAHAFRSLAARCRIPGQGARDSLPAHDRFPEERRGPQRYAISGLTIFCLSDFRHKTISTVVGSRSKIDQEKTWPAREGGDARRGRPVAHRHAREGDARMHAAADPGDRRGTARELLSF